MNLLTQNLLKGLVSIAITGAGAVISTVAAKKTTEIYNKHKKSEFEKHRNPIGFY